VEEKAPDSWAFLTADTADTAEGTETAQATEAVEAAAGAGEGSGGGSRVGGGDSGSDSGSGGSVQPDPPVWQQRPHRLEPLPIPIERPRVYPPPRPLLHFPYSLHCPPPSAETLRMQKAQCGRDTGSARRAWGSAQEATAVLAALNYFSSASPGSVVHESGMFPLEALEGNKQHQLWRQQQQQQQQQQQEQGVDSDSAVDVYESLTQWVLDGSLPLLGASPDGILQHSEDSGGAVEVLEVKCSSPFIRGRGLGPVSPASFSSPASPTSPTSPTSASGASHSMTVSMAPPPQHRHHRHGPGLAAWHVPQLQLEMLCVGAHCRSAVVVTLSVCGARIYRIQRDDQVRLMLRASYIHASSVHMFICSYICSCFMLHASYVNTYICS
jgi:hypothetical protein